MGKCLFRYIFQIKSLNKIYQYYFCFEVFLPVIQVSLLSK